MRRGSETLQEWVDLSAYGLELVPAVLGRAPMLRIRPASGAPSDQPFAGLEVRLTRLGFERASDGTWLRRAGRFVPKRFPVHLPLAKVASRRPGFPPSA